MERTLLYPGIYLNHFRDTRFKNEYLSINFVCSGDLLDPVSASLLSAILGSGTAKHPTESDMEKALLDIYNAGVSLNGYRSGEIFIQPFSVSSYRDRYLPGAIHVREQARDLLFEYIFDPCTENGVFRKDYIEQQKRNKLDLLKAEKNNKQRYAVKKCCQMLCSGEPTAAFEETLKRDLKKATPESVFAFYRQLLDTAPIEVFYFGDQDAEALKSDLSARLSPLFSPKAETVRDRVSPLKKDVQRKTEYIEANQSVLCLGFKTPIVRTDHRYAAWCLMREILCDSPISLLFTGVREKLGLCYYCSPTALATKGVYVISAGIDQRNADAVENAVFSEIEKIKSGNFSAELFKSCKRSYLGALKELRDNPPQTEEWYLRGLLSADWLSPSEMAEKIMKVTAEQVAEAACTLAADSIFLLCAGREHKGENFYE